MSWLAVGAAVAGTMLKTYNANKTADKKNAFLMENMRKQREHEREAGAKTQAELDQMQKQLGSKEEEANRGADLRKQLALKRGMALAGMQATGGGQDITAEIGKQSGQAQDYGQFMADVLSRIDGPGERRRKDAYRRGDLSSFISKLRRHSGADSRIAEMGVASVRPNWLLNLLGEGLTAYGTSGMAGRATAGTAGTAGSGMSGTFASNYGPGATAMMPPGSYMNVPPWEGIGLFGSGGGY